MPCKMTDRLFSLHNHTPFSVGAFTADEVVQAHLDNAGVPVAGVGISDYLFRTPTSREPDNERDFERMFGKEAREYVAMVRDVRERWAGKVEVFCGAEINWPLNRGMLDAMRTLLDGIDYLLFSHVDWAGLTQLANQARRWPCAVGLCQTEIEKQFPNTSREQVVRTLANARIFYEIDAAFLPLRDNDPWYNLLPQHRVAVSLGCDTHDDLKCVSALRVLYEFVQRRGLHARMLDPSNNFAAAPRGNGGPGSARA